MKIFTLLLFLLDVSLIFCKTNGFKTKIIYTSIHENDFKNIKNFSSVATSTTQFIEINKDTSIQNVTTLMQQIEENNNDDDEVEDNDVILSFTSSVLDIFTSRSSTSLFVDFDTSLFKLNSRLTRGPYHDCLKFNGDYENAIVSLVYSVFMKGVAIIGDNNYCSIQFINKLNQTLLKNEKDNEINLNVHTILFDPNSLSGTGLTDEFYSVKTSGVTLIVLLSSIENTARILTQANDFGLLDTTHIWLIPDFYDGMIATHLPTRLMKFEFTPSVFEDKPYERLESTVPQLLTAVQGWQNKSLPDVDLKSQLLHILTTCEHEVSAKFDITISYRNIIENVLWSEVNARWQENEFLVEQNKIPILRSLSGDRIRRSMTAVTIFDSPFTVEQSHMYDPVQKTCHVGIICRKPTHNAENELIYQNTCCVGFVIEFFQKVMDDLNLEIDMYIVADSNYGAFKQGRWNGLIGDVAEKKADIAIAGLTITRDRSEVVDFTVPFMESNMGILVKPEIVELKFINWDFMAPLATELQLALWVVIVGAMVLNYIFENNIYAVSLTSEKYVKESYYPTFESMSYISGVTLQRDLGGRNPVRPGARISAVIFAFGMVIVVTTYTAVLAAQSVQNQEKDPFLGSQDPRMRNPTDDFSFAVLKSSSYETFFKNAETDVLRRMGVFMEKYNVDSTEEGFEKVRNGSLNAYLSDYPYLYYYLSKDRTCTLRLASDTLLVSGLAFAIQKDLPMKKLLNEVILTNLEYEVLLDLQQKWYSDVCQPSFYVTDKVKLTINHFGGLILLLVGAIVCSVPLLLPEYAYYKYLRNYVTNYLKRLLQRQPTKATELFKLTPNTLIIEDNSSVEPSCIDEDVITSTTVDKSVEKSEL